MEDSIDGVRGKKPSGNAKDKDVLPKGRQKYQVLKLQVKSAGEIIKLSTNTKQEHDRITGVFVNIEQQNALVGSEIDLTIDDVEIIPEQFEVTLLNRTIGVSLNEMPYSFNVRALNSKIKLNYKDGAAAGVTYPYGVTVYLRAIDN